MRIAVVDIGSNSTRLLVADVEGDRVTELERRTTVTRLADGVDVTGRLGDEPIQRVERALSAYRTAIESHGATVTIGVLTSAVRDAANGPEFMARVRDEYGIDARVLAGEEEARLTFLGATAGRADTERIAVLDIGGGSTEVIADSGFHTSMQMGVVRFTERHLRADPPPPEELQRLTDAVREVLAAELPQDLDVATLLAVGGTATTAAAIAHELEPYDPVRVHGARVTAGALEEMLARLALMTEAERRHVPGLHPDRAPTILAGITILLECTRALRLDEIEVSEHDILWGAALNRARRRADAG
ncbi:MAG: exopolyphosphatase / guanosine-5-triphosphate,3-diphosphate pyrophosphatase [Solirubrobacteraceae bacterium]|nr:exopolyphosphatase / guanosine-5-triphosphate,3-diphosphate pyrophosphatase [Solirubrobacteraceae bacterium]